MKGRMERNQIVPAIHGEWGSTLVGLLPKSGCLDCDGRDPLPRKAEWRFWMTNLGRSDMLGMRVVKSPGTQKIDLRTTISSVKAAPDS